MKQHSRQTRSILNVESPLVPLTSVSLPTLHFRNTSPLSTAIKMSLFSWPPSPSLVSFQLLIRVILLLVNIIGTGLCFATAVSYRYDGATLGWVTGSFQSVSIVVMPWLILWNHRIIRRLSINHMSGEKQAHPQFGNKILQFVTFVDAIAFVAYVIVYGVFMDTTVSHSWWGNAVLASHASVTVLVCFVLHAILLVTQLLQLRSSRPSAKKYRCPNCNGSMESFHSTASDQSLSTIQGEAVPGQETGTCERTPRASEASQRLVRFEDVNEEAEASSSIVKYGKANEEGEKENDTLLEQDA